VVIRDEEVPVDEVTVVYVGGGCCCGVVDNKLNCIFCIVFFVFVFKEEKKNN
jgi:hypothetical protein